MLDFDELNRLYIRDHDYISLPYDEYFGEMNITEEQKEQRQESAEELEKLFIFLLAAILAAYNNGTYDYQDAIEEAQRGYERIAVSISLTVSEYFLNVHIPMVISEIVRVAIQNPEKEFNFSIDRAMSLAENEANFIWNDAEFQEAVEAGMTEKTWHTMRDKRVRDSHAEMEGVTIPINEPFEVGESLMMAPGDDSLGASSGELLNCRCSVSYS